MSRRSGLFCCGAVVLAVCLPGVVPVAAAARPAPRLVTGTLSKAGYTVLAVAANGKTMTARARTGTFSIRLPAERVSLQLRAADGVYAGPIVVATAERGKRAILGIRAGAKLGRIAVSVRKGYAKLKGKLSKRWVDTAWWARAKNGIPIGAGNFGRVRAKPSRGTVRGDLDLDGVPDVLDIDVNGNLVLNHFDPSGLGRASVITDEFLFKSNLTLTLDQTANADATGSTLQEADAALAENGVLQLGIIPGDSSELDCGQPQSRTDSSLGGLVYCTRGGTGRVFKGDGKCCSPRSDWPRFPDAFDPDGDGFGTLVAPPNSQPAPGSGQFSMFLSHGATTARIGTGDLLIQRVSRDGAELQFPETVEYVFATVPALVSYNDGQGDSETVHYPVPGGNPGPAGPGTRENPFPVKAGPNGDVIVTLTFWRPQRTPIPPETAEWIDIGHLNYAVVLGDIGDYCPQGAFSESDPNLRPLEPADNPGGGYYGLKDLAPDRAANPANTFTFTLNLTRCLAANGRSFKRGETRIFSIQALAPVNADAAEQYIVFTRQ